jgi:hypothetical protein
LAIAWEWLNVALAKSEIAAWAFLASPAPWFSAFPEALLKIF